VDPGPISSTDKSTTNKLFTFLALFIYFTANHSFHSIQLTLCFQQTGGIDNLTGTLGQSDLVVLRRFPVAADAGGGRPATVSSQQLQKRLSSPTGRFNLGFFLRENLLLCSSHLPLGVPNGVLL
jgi:hypothetical protein